MRTSSQLLRRPVEILFGTYRRRVLGLLLLRPGESFHVREVGRLAQVPAGSLHRELRMLTDAGLLLRTTVGNQVHYQANQDCPIHDELAGIFRKTTGLADVLRELLSPLRSGIVSAFVFGSVAQGKETEASDIDLLVVGPVSMAEVVAVCHAGARRLGREVNPVVMTKALFKARYREGDRFVARISQEPKVFVLGDGREFGELAEDPAAQGASAAG